MPMVCMLNNKYILLNSLLFSMTVRVGKQSIELNSRVKHRVLQTKVLMHDLCKTN